MSAVRMCDTQSSPKCHRIFSEKADGWGTGTIMVNRRDPETGRSRSIQETIDTCPECNTFQPMSGPLPMAIQAYQAPTVVTVPDDPAPEHSPAA